MFVVGSFHDNNISVGLPATAFRLLGGFGLIFSVGSDEVVSGVAEASLETRLSPIELIAEILYLYSVLVVRPVSVYFVLVL
ncbi:hypothetical protein MnTg01_01061 [archaeon MnTg01]|nr:hypothetical protein MnTg01_01061 [archaeon MnTg01]